MGWPKISQEKIDLLSELYDLPSEQNIVGIRPRCTVCLGTLKLDEERIGDKRKSILVCNRCRTKFKIKDYWPVPGKIIGRKEDKSGSR